MDGDLGAVEIKAKPRLIGRQVAADSRERHEMCSVRGATPEGPAALDAITAFDHPSRADSARRGYDKCARARKPVATHSFREIAAYPAHATAVADEPTHRSIDRGCSLDNAHEV